MIALKELFFSKENTSYSNETIDILRLIRSENVGVKTFWSLIKFFGSASKALENIEEFSIRGGKKKPIKVFSKQEAQREFDLLSKNNAKILHYTSPDYPKLLLKISDPPPIFSYKGNVDILKGDKIAIVGARNASINGISFASKLAKELVQRGYTTVSGLARGIDTAVHKAASDKTIAVIAGGIDHIYPIENLKLYEKIAETGLIIAELPVGSKPLGQHFPQRNRLISGLSIGCLVVEARLNSGSLITSRFAIEQNREVFAVPGFPLDPRCQGTNKLIKDGAHLVESIDDIIDNLATYHNLKKSLEDSFANNNDQFINNYCHINQVDDKMRKMVLDLLSSSPVGFDEIITLSNLPLKVIYMIILELELAGNIAKHPGNKISLIYN